MIVLKNARYGKVNLAGISYRESGKTECIQSHPEPYVCCVSAGSYFTDWCPVTYLSCTSIDESDVCTINH